MSAVTETPKPSEQPSTATPTSLRVRYRVRFAKSGLLRWTSHRDLARLWERLVRRALDLHREGPSHDGSGDDGPGRTVLSGPDHGGLRRVRLLRPGEGGRDDQSDEEKAAGRPHVRELRWNSLQRETLAARGRTRMIGGRT